MNTYPKTAGHKERNGTSEQAARTTDASAMQDLVFAELCKKSGSADEIADRLGIDRLSIRPRLSELKLLGKARKTNKRRRNESGKTAVVWEANVNWEVRVNLREVDVDLETLRDRCRSILKYGAHLSSSSICDLLAEMLPETHE